MDYCCFRSYLLTAIVEFLGSQHGRETFVDSNLGILLLGSHETRIVVDMSKTRIVCNGLGSTLLLLLLLSRLGHGGVVYVPEEKAEYFFGTAFMSKMHTAPTRTNQKPRLHHFCVPDTWHSLLWYIQVAHLYCFFQARLNMTEILLQQVMMYIMYWIYQIETCCHFLPYLDSFSTSMHAWHYYLHTIVSIPNPSNDDILLLE